MKKGDASMWWIIIGAVIALVVLIILMVMFVGKTRPLEQGLSDCEGKGGLCATKSCPGYTLSSSAFTCKADKICCIGTPKKCDNDQDCGGTGGSCSGDFVTGQKYCR